MPYIVVAYSWRGRLRMWSCGVGGGPPTELFHEGKFSKTEAF